MLFLILSLFCTYTHALTKFDTNCTLPVETVNYVSAPNTRGILTILWATPGRSPTAGRLRAWAQGSVEYWGHKYGSQMSWFMITILAPEVLLAKYGYDLSQGKCDLDILQDFARDDGIEWTTAHSLFANMGGFVMRLDSASPGRRPFETRLGRPHEIQAILRVLNTNEDGLPCPSSASRGRASMQTLTSSSSNIDSSNTPVPPPVRNATAQPGYRYSLKSRDILLLREARLLSRLPKITKEELEDRSKEDWILRSITVLQIVWMGFQTSVRLQASLEVTDLEVSAFAFALCAIWMSSFPLQSWSLQAEMSKSSKLMVLEGQRQRCIRANKVDYL
ncbi:hypothetical protein BO82DRAFT_417926 [Aspergillus uvarum CBS 121591]|uniref:Uncharacterized protein n=1 Tax=Aspergillus uvarum CBS 121591 TaxID=1448315 RepID=A0A319C835_9EURO|nr:hypothetical protein BO82DRAFT_417926 [Aspergillus uvarum CBS 121591]PYH80270.1 hypothetical protein BO82DRAFT_417926 [Aspergillus uvarum CBS 121591]